MGAIPVTFSRALAILALSSLISPSVFSEEAGEPPTLNQALEILQQIPTGQALLEKAQYAFGFSEWRKVASILAWGSVSKTDAVLTRYFNPDTGKEERKRQVTIYLKRASRLQELVLDIAHELTHATATPEWDPYDPELTAGKYIWVSIEGRGGEVDALLNECQVGLELARRKHLSYPPCARYLPDGQEKVSRERIRKDFYRVGKWNGELHRKLGHEIERFPLLSESPPLLISSTGKTPYPFALLKEFEEINGAACENSRKRWDSLTARTPSLTRSSRDSISRFLRARCRNLASS